MAKPMLVTLPFLLLLLDVWPLGRVTFLSESTKTGVRDQRSELQRIVIEKIPLFVVVAASSIVTFLVQRQGGATAGFGLVPLGYRIANALMSYALYIRNMFWPVRLAALYPYSAQMPLWQGAA